jgi:hypothetical protein
MMDVDSSADAQGVAHCSVVANLQGKMNDFHYTRMRQNWDKDSNVLDYPSKLWPRFILFMKDPEVGGFKWDRDGEYIEQYATADTTGLRRDVKVRKGNPPRTTKLKNGYDMLKHHQTQTSTDFTTPAVSAELGQ